jgi:hypothetical protein
MMDNPSKMEKVNERGEYWHMSERATVGKVSGGIVTP